MDKIKSRLRRWKGRNLSMARICLIKSVLSSIPLFYMSMFFYAYSFDEIDCEYSEELPLGGVLKGERSFEFLRKRFVSLEMVAGLE